MFALYLSTDVEHFTYWITHHVSEYYDHPQTHRRGRMIWKQAPVKDKDRPILKLWGKDGVALASSKAEPGISGRFLIRVLGYWEEPKKGYRLSAELEFLLEIVSATRIKIMANASDTVSFHHHFIVLLDDIAKHYPETAEAITEYKRTWLPPNRPLLQRPGLSGAKTASPNPVASQESESIIIDATRYGDQAPYHFAIWLAEYTGDVVRERFPTSNGYYTLHSFPFPQGPYPAGGSTADMLGQFHPADQEAPVADTPWLIRVEFNKPINDKMRVTVRCREPAVKPYFEELVKELQRFTIAAKPASGAYGWGTLRTADGEEIDLEPETFATVLATMGGSVSAERMAEFLNTMVATQRGRELLRQTQQDEVQENAKSHLLARFGEWLQARDRELGSRYPRPAKYTLIVPRALEVVDAALNNHARDWRPGIPRLEIEDPSSEQILKYVAVIGGPWFDGQGRMTADYRVRLGWFRLTGMGRSKTEVLITRGYWEVHDDREFLTSPESIELYRRFFDEFAEKLINSFDARGEKAINPGTSFEQVTEMTVTGLSSPDDIRPTSDTREENQGRKAGRKPLTEDEWEKRFSIVEKILKKKQERNISSEELACQLEGLPYGTFKHWKRKWRDEGREERWKTEMKNG